jgi:hypothetical protein
MKNLFGEEVEIQDKTNSPYIKWKRENNYRESRNDRKCKNCDHLIKKDYHNKTYYKCELLGHSFGPATDIRLKNVCKRHERTT